MRRDLGRLTLLLVSTAVLALAAVGCGGSTPPPEAADPGDGRRVYEIPYRGAVSFEVPPGWQDRINQPPGGLPPTIIFTPEQGDAFVVTLSVLGTDGADSALNSPERIREMVEAAWRNTPGIDPAQEPPVSALNGEEANGHYFTFVDPRGDLPLDAFREVRVGAVGLDDLLIRFAVQLRQADPELLNQALQLVSSAGRMGRSTTLEDLAGAIDIDGAQVTNRAAGYSFTLPEGWSVREGSSPETLIVQVEGSQAAFAVLVKGAESAELAAEAEKIKQILLESAGGYHYVRQESLTIAGEPAVELIFAHQVGPVQVKLSSFVLVHEGRTYQLGFEAPDQELETLGPELRALIGSLEFSAAG